MRASAPPPRNPMKMAGGSFAAYPDDLAPRLSEEQEQQKALEQAAQTRAVLLHCTGSEASVYAEELRKALEVFRPFSKGIELKVLSAAELTALRSAQERALSTLRAHTEVLNAMTKSLSHGLTAVNGALNTRLEAEARGVYEGTPEGELEKQELLEAAAAALDSTPSVNQTLAGIEALLKTPNPAAPARPGANTKMGVYAKPPTDFDF